ncbi:F-box only protein 39-like [Scomber scombrus]|uniref:F-box only protein 39-like n=1 Tax=Scomber scombrus TaxID=13677 RepID=A0AAV1N3A8_SCOSC|nr:F-box only protein 39-like [Scomber scombrus]
MDSNSALRDESILEESFVGEDDDSEEETGDDDSDLTDEGGESSSEKKTSGWGLLPHVCLRHVFNFLSDRDRMRAHVVCHHWHKVMRSPSLWRFRYFHFSGRLSKLRLSEYSSAVAYARSLGVYLERLEVCVCPPRRSLAAQRVEQAICGLFSELTRLKAPLKSLSIIRLELDRNCWTLALRNSLVNCLTQFLQRALRLTTINLNWMRNSMQQGIELLSALSQSQRRFPPTRCYISSLHLEGFFSSSVHVHLNSNVPSIMHHLRGLTDLSLSYSSVSDELLVALQHRNRGGRQNPSRDRITLQTFSLNCSINEPHRQPVCGSSWATLASSSPDLQVKITVHQIINTDRLARILLPEIPMTDFTMIAFYAPDEGWTARPILCDILPHYRCSLQNLTLDLSNCSERLDVELVELVKMCERLEQLGVWAFLEVVTVEKLLHIRLTKRRLLNKIRVRIYSNSDSTVEQEDQLEQLMSSYVRLPPELEFFAIIYPYV